MKILLRALRYLLTALLVIFILGFLAGWWILHRSLPQVDGAISLPEVKEEVTIDRDEWGVPHIRAGSVGDLITAQGYVLAQDRLWQMDILRRVAAGELSEIFGATTIDLDRLHRTLGLRVAAEREANNLDPETRGMLEAYARGVNRYIEERRANLPWEFVALRYQPKPWRPADSLLISGYMYQTLTNTWQAELKRAKVTELAGPERARDLFVADSPRDHVIVGGAQPSESTVEKRPRTVGNTKKRNAEEHRENRDPPLARATYTSARSVPDGSPEMELWKTAATMLEEFDEEVRASIGSNNWVVDGSHTASGKPLLANDTHLELRVPCIWYVVHLTAPGWNVKGFTLPGAPLVIIGHNDRIAWGFTNNGADVEDLYIETFNPANPNEYLVNGKYERAEVRTERIHVKRGDDVLFDVRVTRHGPIVVREQGGRGYALKWTATEPGGLGSSYGLLGQAQNWNEFLDTMRRIPGPAQNAVYADVHGNIGFVVAARIPVRKSGDGSVPVRGDTDDYEWTGYVPFEELPQVVNPPGGIIATANSRVVGPAYPHYLTDRWASPYRTERIYELLAEKKNLQPADFLTIQNDIVSPPHRFLAEELVRASKVAKPKDSRAQDLVARLANWDGGSPADSVETAFVESTRHILLRKLLKPVLGEAVNLYEWRDAVFLEKVMRERPAQWLPAGFSSYDELLMASGDEAVEQLTRETKQSQASGWRWGHINALQMLHPLGRSGLMRRLLSVGPQGQSGSVYSIKAMQPSHGPAMRFVADLSNFDNSLMNITLGQSGQYGSRHYRDQFSAWFDGRGIASPFSDAAEEKARVHRLRLRPTKRASTSNPQI